MKKLTVICLLLPLFIQAQNYDIPHVKFEQGSILFYIPSQSSYAPLLPAYKPGFVHILQTPSFQSKSNQDISDHLAFRIEDLASKPMSQNQKVEFLEKYACLVLINYSNVSELNTSFYDKAVSLQDDPNQQIKANAIMVVRMVEMYLERI